MIRLNRRMSRQTDREREKDSMELRCFRGDE